MTSSGISGPAHSKCSINLCRDGQRTKEYQYFWVLKVEGRISSLANLEPNIHALTCHGCLHARHNSFSVFTPVDEDHFSDAKSRGHKTCLKLRPLLTLLLKVVLIKTISEMDSSTSMWTESFSLPGHVKTRPSEHGIFWLWHTEELNFFSPINALRNVSYHSKLQTY